MKVFTAPEQIPISKSDYKIFLAGTIEMGTSHDWQSDVINHFNKKNNKKFTIFNPRRVHWDSSWEQSFEAPNFFQQVSWEMDAMDKADIIIMNLLPESKSPISLLELGLYAKSGKLIVSCPEGFYRRGNVQMVCNKYNIPLYSSIKELLYELKVEDYIKKQ